jgi:hypothetical protein
LIEATQDTKHLCLIEVLLDPLDRSPALQRLTKRLAERI